MTIILMFKKDNEMLQTAFIILFMFTQITVKSEKPFKSVPVTVKTYENDTVLLPCYIDDTDTQLRVRWYKNQELLGDTHVPHEVLPPRVRLHANYSLQVDSLQAQDTADYTCEIIRPEPWGPIRQTHSIEVQYSPTVKTVPEDGFVEVRKGEFVDIGCETTGTPTPIVDWRKNGEAMALLEHRSRIRFRAEHRLLAGVYECVVNNGVGDPIKASITVVIQDAPVVAAERIYVHTAIGLRAALSARVDFSIPPARTHWYREGRPVHTDDRVVQMIRDNVHQLIFRSVWKSDFGNYTFRAENKLGMADLTFKLTGEMDELFYCVEWYVGKTVTVDPSQTVPRSIPRDNRYYLTGVPNIASFKVDAVLNKATSTSFTLIWEVDSYSTIIEYNLWLRPYYGRPTPESDVFTTEPPANHWRKIVVPGDSSDGPIHSAIYTVRGLTPSTVYEAIVTSRNRLTVPTYGYINYTRLSTDANVNTCRTNANKDTYLRWRLLFVMTGWTISKTRLPYRFGWSKPSSILHFATEPGAGRTKPSTSDYSDITPVLEDTEPEANNISEAQIFERLNYLSSGARVTPCLVAILLLCWTLLI